MHTIERMKMFAFPVVIEKDEDGFYVECPVLEGAYTQGDTYEEALINIKDAIILVLEVMQDEGKIIPESFGDVPGSEMVEVTI
jgi:predicted RNase H-like HicB family nuclease